VSIVNTNRARQAASRLAGKLLSTQNLRQNKLFFRISDIKMADSVRLEGMWIYDRSTFLRGALIWDVTNADSLRLGADKFSGEKLSEYGASSVDWRVFLHYKRYF
jgi:hypothetical protein